MARPAEERTPDERAAAAAERAARRAARDGDGDGATPPPGTFAAATRPAPPPEAAPEPQPEPEPEPEREPEPRFERDREPRIERDPEPRFARDPEPPVERDPEPAPAASPRRLSAMATRSPQRPRRPPPPRRPPAHTQSHGRRRAGALLGLTLIVAALYVINATFQPFHGDGDRSVQLRVPAGADAGRIGKLLDARGVVDSATFFQLNATITGRRGGLRPGVYTLRRGMTNAAAIEALTKGPKAKVVPTIQVGVPEGLSIREAAPLVDKTPLQGSYLKAARSARTLRKVRALGAPRRSRTPEGFLFPATYTLIDGAPARNLVDRQLAAFDDNFSKVDLSYAKRKNLTRYDVLIIASMIEREAQLDRERPLVSAVIYNRLADGMTLGIDATIRYYENNWSRPLRVSELERPSGYNTRLNRGLPPTPIGNPGLASIKAAANPARKDYLFYVRKPGKSGEHAFSSTDAQFGRDVARYQASREP